MYRFGQFGVFRVPGGTCDVTNRLKFNNSDNSDIIFEFPVPKLVNPHNFNVLFRFLATFYGVDHFGVFRVRRGTCDVTSRVKFNFLQNSDIIFEFPVSKLVYIPNFKVQFLFFVKLLAFDHISVFYALLHCVTS